MISVRTAGEFQEAFAVSRETLDRLVTFQDLLVRWNRSINLVSPASLDDFWHRHAADSAQLLRFGGTAPRLWADFGSGGGFPGLVLAIMSPDAVTEFILVESDARKAAFLAQAAALVAPRTRVIRQRGELLPPLMADVLTARALAPLVRLLPLAQRHLRPGGRAVFPKGRGADRELTEARRSWTIECEIFPSLTDSDASVLKIGVPQRA
jgi:16S rRNA (guanine527-N7)-methyltransferase